MIFIDLSVMRIFNPPCFLGKHGSDRFWGFDCSPPQDGTISVSDAVLCEKMTTLWSIVSDVDAYQPDGCGIHLRQSGFFVGMEMMRLSDARLRGYFCEPAF
jgi:hypothetical protein